MINYSVPLFNCLSRRVGKSIILPPVYGKGAAQHKASQANADQIVLAITTLVPPEYRSVYQTVKGAE
jgi:hypothetical protein